MENTVQVPQTNMSDMMFKENLRKMSADMAFYGMFTIIVGAISCLGIISAIIGVPVIIAGLRMREAGQAFKDFGVLDDMNALKYAIERQQKMMAILKILAIIYIVFFALYILFFILFGGAILSSMMQNSY
jgi:Family of unknown function (DUF5362)